MRRFPLLAFGALVLATVAAFFITQHLKISTPLLAGTPAPFPAAINPVHGVTCYQPGIQRYVDHRRMTISFYLLNHSDTVDVYVVDQGGRKVATLATRRFMSGGAHPVRSQFVWNGREANGSLAPDGKYDVRVHLSHQRRTVTISDNSGPVPVTVKTIPPMPSVTSVSPRVVSLSHLTGVRISYAGNETRAATVLIYRIGGRQQPVLVKSFLTSGRGQTATWDGLIRRRPAPVGTYLIGLEVSDAACNTGYFPATLSSLSSNDAVAELTVRR